MLLAPIKSVNFTVFWDKEISWAMEHIIPKTVESENTSAANAAGCSVNAQTLSFIIIVKKSSSFN